ncbi:uncharacterized protein FIBRA_04847 [Fibroporia radiculosa]|uniref:Uncharacterized protein n=1 Tax=Fibroporia radiculosa TaxID=599839 RepID=J4GPX4_9APHY|nr:uncharacterized protein FIBRA_04847 [Fibroporia radiculosa]CCM02740.1 predicted protein [Fibroporia radiculosa]
MSPNKYEFSFGTRPSRPGGILGRCLSSYVAQTIRQRFIWLKWAFLLHCVLSSAFFAVRVILPNLGMILPVNRGIPSLAVQITNPLAGLPMAHLLTKLTAIHPQPKALDPYVLKATVDPAAVTACLWSTDQDLSLINSWAQRWTGPISLLVTTKVEPSSTEHAALLTSVLDLRTKHSLLASTLSVHLVHLDAQTRDNPNAFLNLARLFSQTPYVALFPGNLSTAPPKTLYRSLKPAFGSTSSSRAIVGPSLQKEGQRPAILTTRGQTGFPFSLLAPVVLPRDDPLWCTERFFLSSTAAATANTRAADWEECLWQIWLENFGDVDVRPTRGWLHDVFPAAAPTGSDAAMTKLRKRLVTKFRSETCVLATRQLAALRSADKALDAKKARWLKRSSSGSGAM